MTELHELTNGAIEVTVGGKKLRVRRLSIESVFGSLESLVISERIEQVHQVAKSLEGKERIAYLNQATRDLPSGEELQELVRGKMGSVTGVRFVLYQAIKQDQPEMELNDVNNFLHPDEADKIAGLMEWLCGLRTTLEDDEDKEESEKKVKMMEETKMS